MRKGGKGTLLPWELWREDLRDGTSQQWWSSVVFIMWTFFSLFPMKFSAKNFLTNATVYGGTWGDNWYLDYITIFVCIRCLYKFIQFGQFIFLFINGKYIFTSEQEIKLLTMFQLVSLMLNGLLLFYPSYFLESSPEPSW